MTRILDWLIGCHHKHTSRMFKLRGCRHSYIVCLDCGATKTEEWFDAR